MTNSLQTPPHKPMPPTSKPVKDGNATWTPQHQLVLEQWAARQKQVRQQQAEELAAWKAMRWRMRNAMTIGLMTTAILLIVLSGGRPISNEMGVFGLLFGVGVTIAAAWFLKARE
jgi:hypothetical protein